VSGGAGGTGVAVDRYREGRLLRALPPEAAWFQERGMIDRWNNGRTGSSGRNPWRDSGDLDDEAGEDCRKHREAERKKSLDQALDRGLEDTFPGSDPVAVTQPPASARDKDRP
jgi:hypothetical protein